MTADRDGHVARVLRALRAEPELVARLASVPGADLRGLLLRVMAQRAQTRTPADLLRRYERSEQLQVASGAPALRELERALLARLPKGFDEVTLAPHAPLGVSSVLGRFSQDRVLSTLADTEVVSDSTNVLALECARRRRAAAEPRAAVRLAASHRLLRPREDVHFGLLGLCTAGRDHGSFRFELDALAEHLGWHLRAIAATAPHLPLTVRLTDLSDEPRRSELLAGLRTRMAPDVPAVTWWLDDRRRQGRGYYTQACFAVDVTRAGREPANVVDGGLTDWTARMLSDRKERLLISGLGSERLLALSRDDPC